MNHEEIHNLNGPITGKEIELVMKNLPTNKSPGAVSYTGQFFQIFKEDLITILLKLFEQ